MGKNSKIVALLKLLIMDLCCLISRQVNHKVPGNRSIRCKGSVDLELQLECGAVEV